MTIPIWITEAAEAFWHAVGEYESFPRDLRVPIAIALPVALVSLPRLHLSGINAWLRRQGIIHGLDGCDRPLRACLVARRGKALIFLDGSDPADEQRFSLAHETAHYLHDYWLPRRRAVERLGPAVLEVLDGDREPEAGERINAVLSRVELGYHAHLLDREPNGVIADRAVVLAERYADLLGGELLAPAAAVLCDLPALPNSQRFEILAQRLVDEFGLPRMPANAYAAHLLPPPADVSLIRRLGIEV